MCFILLQYRPDDKHALARQHFTKVLHSLYNAVLVELPLQNFAVSSDAIPVATGKMKNLDYFYTLIPFVKNFNFRFNQFV